MFICVNSVMMAWLAHQLDKRQQNQMEAILLFMMFIDVKLDMANMQFFSPFVHKPTCSTKQLLHQIPILSVYFRQIGEGIYIA